MVGAMMFRNLRGNWSRVAALRTIFVGLAFAAVVWILGEPFAGNFYHSLPAVYTFLTEGYAIALGIVIALFGGYKLARSQ